MFLICWAGLLRDGKFELQVQSGPRRLVLNIYTAEKVERLVCNGQEVTPQQVGSYHCTAEFRL